MSIGEVLVVAATPRELAPARGWMTLACGVGPVEAAAATAAALTARRPGAVLHVGIAGASRASGLAPATLVIGSETRYHDLQVPASLAPSVLTPDARLLAALGAAMPSALVRPIGTSARVGGTLAASADLRDTDVEAMEGFAVLRAASLAGVPAIEVRAISNDIEETDRARWHFDAAFAAITSVTPTLVAAVSNFLLVTRTGTGTGTRTGTGTGTGTSS
jgi:nucleoside phosphorylase